MTDFLLAFDPGAHSAAWAYFVNGRLSECKLERAQGSVTLGTALDSRFKTLIAWGTGWRAVIELPQVYGRRSPVDPNDLIVVAVTVGRIMQALGDRVDAKLVHPHAWKGNVPADTMLTRIESRLDAHEVSALQESKAPQSLRHNVLDAVGLGLHTLKRL